MKQYTNSIRNSSELSKFGNILSPTKEHLNQLMDISFHFDLSSEQQSNLDSALESGQVMTLGSIHQMFSSDSTEMNNLIDWLKSNGYTNVRKSNSGRDVYASSSADNISKTLNCDMISVDTGNNIITGANTSPKLPAVLSGIHSINGLQPFIQRQKKSKKSSEIRNYKNTLRTFKSNVVNFKPPYTVNSIKTAYNGLNSWTGSNQTIGILIDCFPNNADLVKFWTANSISTNVNRVTKINVRNSMIPAPTGEESLDVEWTSGIAPNANIKVYASGDLRFSSLDVCLDRMIADASIDPTFRIISISLGLGEKEMSVGEMNTENAKYQTLRLLGVNIFVSSGDSGSSPDNILQTEFPACNPNVVSVGGTSLQLNSNGGKLSETAWVGSGGGISSFYPKPSFQSKISGNNRMVPDISSVADPNTGAYVVLSGMVYQIGGTSWSAPVWAGICALVNEARLSSGKTRIGFLPNYIYNMISTNKFGDITSGNNGVYSTSVGYDKVTGIGVPNINNLISALVAI